MKYIFSVIILFVLNFTSATGQGKFVPNGVRVGVNLNTAIKTLTNDEITQHEITGDINFHKYLLAVDLGQAKMDRRGANLRYLTEGFYYKAGVDVNFIHSMEGNNVLSLGLRYARSDYENTFAYQLSHPLWGSQNNFTSNVGASSQWAEGLLILKADAWHNFQVGFSLGLKFARSDKGDHNVEVYEIPGYGYAEAPSMWSFNYFLYYYLPFKKK